VSVIENKLTYCKGLRLESHQWRKVFPPGSVPVRVPLKLLAAAAAAVIIPLASQVSVLVHCMAPSCVVVETMYMRDHSLYIHPTFGYYSIVGDCQVNNAITEVPRLQTERREVIAPLSNEMMTFRNALGLHSLNSPVHYRNPPIT
jgi:hypothetical protein